ncbi:aminoacyl-histidine dipeptidase [Parasulfuritortus cantonensis]|uniref:Cytosol non-specific dipeptidase n=1 Tax=Parasulfuritortus cantonensis TaxID=2528202 RepID=A0A4R1B9D7_9PROT|nr:beta-Ala-His dipeptidase [Parasulfuritortus cantonensis]TCJ13513.1 aminoacyl-histidine dipeptidase [Parasulfuritortus cantonensis]
MENLQPRPVWAHFAALCAIPRPSGREAAVRDHLLAWARANAIAARVDAAGNLILSKPASPGGADLPGVILQGHLDMVCQANAGTGHDFEHDPIRPVLRDGWLVAEATTLGADNGIGVALALAALTEPGLVHPALEVLLTVDEEDGMHGAHGLAPGSLAGHYLINLDSEDWGYFYLGCAGGVDIEVEQPVERVPMPADRVVRRITVSGLRGGHSGLDIHLGRGNAIKLLAEAVRELAGQTDLNLIELAGGSARNAIPREAWADVALPAAATAGLAAWAAAKTAEWRTRFAAGDAGVALACSPDGTAATGSLAPAAQARLLDFLADARDGVAAMSADFPGTVAASDNLGVAALTGTAFRATIMARGLADRQTDGLADAIVAQAAGHGLAARKTGAYPGWTPDPASPLLARCRAAYAEHFGAEAGLRVIHAGLECGVLAGSHPGLDMISFGPDIRGAHAPGEAVEVASVARAWSLLKAVLGALAQP